MYIMVYKSSNYKQWPGMVFWYSQIQNPVQTKIKTLKYFNYITLSSTDLFFLHFFDYIYVCLYIWKQLTRQALLLKRKIYSPLKLQHVNTSTLSHVNSKRFSCLWSYNWNFIETDSDIQNFPFSSSLSISTFDKPNRLFTYKPCRGELQTSRPKDNSPHIKLVLRQLASNS